MSTSTFQLGAARARIQTRSRNIGMMGYGAPQNIVKEALTDLYVRAWVLEDSAGQLLAFANAEICFITQAIQQEVARRLQAQLPGLSEHNLLLSAQHTHSAPAGYSHFMFYNVGVSGFQPEVFESVVVACVEAIASAYAQRRECQLSAARLPFPEQEDVAFNRSLRAYNANPENTNLSHDQTHLAIDREMYLLKAEQAGQTSLVCSWFGVHATNIGPDNTGVCGDNKGFAALQLEQQLKAQGQDAVAIFAQGAAGDVSPNFHGEGKAWKRGKLDHDVESARFNGRLQARHAQRILEQATFLPLSGEMDVELIYADLSQIACDPDFTDGVQGCHTVPASHGVPFLEGTAVDGKGVNKALATALAAYCKLQQGVRLKHLELTDPAKARVYKQELRMQAPKVVAVESGARRFLGFDNLESLPIPERFEPLLDELRLLFRKKAIQEHSWTPQILPLQLACIGPWAILTFPGELTTTAARRLRQTVLETLSQRGVQQLVICCYSNAYFGYTTTPEEYDCQAYEGGHTVFGRYTLPAFQTLYRQLAQEMLKPADQRQLDRSTRPVSFSEAELALRTEMGHATHLH